MNDHATDLVLGALGDLWDAGCPIPGPDLRERLLDVGARRWRSFSRRSNRAQPTFGDRLDGLAKGLRDAFEADLGLAGPTLRDYECVAQVIGSVLDGRKAPSPHATDDRLNNGVPSPCPACGAGPEHATDPEHMYASICRACGHPRYYDYKNADGTCPCIKCWRPS